MTRAILLAGTCDLPAKCLVCNTVQYNGFYGCFKCKQVGQTVKTGKKEDMYTLFFFFLTTPMVQNILIRKRWKSHIKQPLKENLSMALKGHRGLVDSNITILLMEQE